ncbi:MAG: response regulator transcription factor [Ilumatobacteraceae bacterium]
MTSLLLVEDDERISQPLVQLLTNEGFTVQHVDRGELALAAARANRPDIVLLDLSLPDLDGLDVCRTLRDEQPGMPIVMLTARNEEVDVIVGLGAGADDYITKPFRVGELIARIRARLRLQAVAAAGVGGEAVHGVRVDTAARRAWRHDNELALSPKEFDLLAYLAERPGLTLRREQIMSDVWDEHWWGSTRTLDTHIAALRRKLGDTADPPELISTIRGVGFRFEAD